MLFWSGLRSRSRQGAAFLPNFGLEAGAGSGLKRTGSTTLIESLDIIKSFNSTVFQNGRISIRLNFNKTKVHFDLVPLKETSATNIPQKYKHKTLYRYRAQ